MFDRILDSVRGASRIARTGMGRPLVRRTDGRDGADVARVVRTGQHAGRGSAAAAKAQHPVHHGRRHRHHAAEHLPSRPDGRRDAQHRSHRQRRCALHALLRRAELHCRAQCLLHRHASAAHRHDPPATAGQPVLSAPRHARGRQVPARPRLQHRRVRQEPPRRPHRRAADRARLPGILGLPLSPRRDAGRELPRHQQDLDAADRRSAVHEHADPGSRPGSPRGGSENVGLPDASTSRVVVPLLQRHCRQPNVRGRGPVDVGTVEDGRRGDLG